MNRDCALEITWLHEALETGSEGGAEVIKTEVLIRVRIGSQANSIPMVQNFVLEPHHGDRIDAITPHRYFLALPISDCLLRVGRITKPFEASQQLNPRVLILQE